MDKLGLLSDSISSIISQILSNQNICKYLFYQDSKKPLDEADLVMPATNLFFSKIYPYPPDASIGDQDKIELRVYYPSIDFTTATTEKTKVCFDLVLSKSPDIWLIGVDGKDKMRPFEIHREIINHFTNTELFGMKLTFKNGRLLPVNDKFVAFSFYAEMLNVNSGKK